MLVPMLTLMSSLWAAAPACAADAIPEAAIWRVSGPEVSLRFAFPRGAARLLAQPGKPVPATEAVARLVLAKSAVEQDHKPCPAVDLGYDLGRVEPLYLGPALMGFEMLFHCPRDAGSLVLREQALADLGVPQLGLTTVYAGTSPPVTRLTAGERGVQLPAGQPKGSSAFVYAWLGMQGLPGRGLRVLALCGLLLAVRRRGELIGLACGVSAGYLAAGIAAACGWVLAPGPAAAFDGALVLLAAALVMGRATAPGDRKPALGLAAVAAVCALAALLRGQAPIAVTLAGAGLLSFSLLWLESLPGVCAARLALTGLALSAVDGFALPRAVAPLHTLVPLPAAGALGYNTGAAAAALLLLAVLTQLRRWAGTRARLVDAPLLADMAATALCCAGAFQALTV